ncbi:MAG: D-alanyl-D-alanine carboxypeptidase, partial [Candidatus Omnitrophica bacterium]|nr:D-alanyl-D-alanine carboxypeptidase [Candidatus Omnitrophota bacterium]
TCLLIWCTLTFAGCTREVELPEVNVNAKCAIIIDAKTGEVLFEKNADKAFPPASTAKVMTAIIAVEALPLGSDMVPTNNVKRVEPTIIKLTPGVRYKLKDLLAAILIKSANDAALTIAENTADREKDFARLMNQKAEELGMNNTYFDNSSGLPTGRPDNQYTTARDLSLMMKYTLRHKVILEAMSRKDRYISGSDNKKIYLKTHNKNLLREDNAPWGKTGYTREARRTFVGLEPSPEPRIVFALLQSDDLWNDITELNDKGLVLHRMKSRTWFDDLVDWVKFQRNAGEEKINLLLYTQPAATK